MRTRSFSLALAIAAMAAHSLAVASPTLAATTVVPFASTGAEQTWAVPPGISTVHVIIVGGRGAGSGGFGGRVEGDLGVAGVATLYIEVGGSGSGSAGGFNGGGNGGSAANPGFGGGGASDIRTITRTGQFSTDSRLAVAAGGGGHGNGSPNPGGAGGDAGSPGGSVAGGGGGGGAATVAGGPGFGGLGSPSSLSGQNGAISVAGSGGGGSPTDNGGGGGGGSGYFGGGGGGSASGSGGGGGGGGASYAGGLAGTSIGVDATGVPSITISYDAGPGPTPTPPPDHGTVDATVTMAQSVVCLELSTSTIDFGTRQFGDVGVAATPGITTTNCGGISESVFAHGTDASGSGPTTWTLNDAGSCAGGTLPADSYGLTVERQDTAAQVRLSTTNKSLATLAGGVALNHLARIDTPCSGSTGAGVVMTMHIVFVATE
jgi:hypothetical protein